MIRKRKELIMMTVYGFFVIFGAIFFIHYLITGNPMITVNLSSSEKLIIEKVAVNTSNPNTLLVSAESTNYNVPVTNAIITDNVGYEVASVNFVPNINVGKNRQDIVINLKHKLSSGIYDVTLISKYGNSFHSSQFTIP